MDHDPKAFGLTQRARHYDAYLDNEARYDQRPSLWVEPLEAWGPGSVELVEIPSEKETHDNIVAFWRPSSPLEPGRRYDYNYRLHWVAAPHDDGVPARVAATRVGRPLEGEGRLFVIDYDYTQAIPHDVRIDVTASKGAIGDVHGEPVAATRQFRVTFSLDPRNEDLIELRLTLSAGDKPWSETWLYRWTR
jgi:glucans biosynthesis protein